MMAFKIVSREDAKRQYDIFCSKRAVDESILDENYKKIRKYCVEKYNAIKQKVKSNQDSLSRLHEIDMFFGIELYKYLKNDSGFTNKYESNYAFWRYLACYVIPDIVSDRWNIDKTDHFYSKPTGIYPFQVYWYINLSWQGSVDETIGILKDNQEDHILQLVDRPSRIGVNLSLYRRIMKELSFINPKNRKDIFRFVMIRNTSKLINMRPELYPGGIDEYVRMLFKDVKEEEE